MFTGLEAGIPGAKHATKKCFWLIMIVQLCPNGLNNHARGLLLFMSSWNTVQQHLLHMHRFTESPTGGDMYTSCSSWFYWWGNRGLDYYKTKMFCSQKLSLYSLLIMLLLVIYLSVYKTAVLSKFLIDCFSASMFLTPWYAAFLIISVMTFLILHIHIIPSTHSHSHLLLLNKLSSIIWKGRTFQIF